MFVRWNKRMSVYDTEWMNAILPNPIHSSPTSTYLFNPRYMQSWGTNASDKGDSGSKGLEMGTSWIPSKRQKEGWGGGGSGEKSS